MKKKDNTGRIVAGVVLAVLIVAGISYFVYAFFKAEKMEVKGNGKYAAVYIEDLADIPEDTHMLMLDEEKIIENVEREPYLEVLDVKKKLPQTVLIEVKERQPRALISYASQALLTDIEGNVLEIKDAATTSGYPVVDGLAISGVALGRPISTDDNFKITVMGELLDAMENRDLTKTIVRMDLSDINNIKLYTPEGLTIKFGQADGIPEKVRWIYKMLPTLKKDGRTNGVLDVSTGTFPVYELSDSELPQASEPAETASQDAGAVPDGEGATPSAEESPSQGGAE